MICIYHSRDLDGWMSAAIVKLKFPEVVLIGWDYGQPVPDVTGHDKVIICDISFPLANMDLIASGVKIIQRDFIWIDHHASAIKECSFEVDGKYIAGYGGVRDTKFAACELTWQFFFPDVKMPEIVRLLGRYDCFGHKGTAEEQKVLEFQYGARSVISNPQDAYEYLTDNHVSYDFVQYISATDRILETGRSIYKYLCTEASQIYKRAFPVVFLVHEDDSHVVAYQFLCVNQERFNPINFGIDYHADKHNGFLCFHYANGRWNFSLYNDNGEVDCSEICKMLGGGGHKGASGFVAEGPEFIASLTIKRRIDLIPLKK